MWKHSWCFKENWDASNEMSVLGAETRETTSLMFQQNVNTLLSLYFIDFEDLVVLLSRIFFFMRKEKKNLNVESLQGQGSREESWYVLKSAFILHTGTYPQGSRKRRAIRHPEITIN